MIKYKKILRNYNLNCFIFTLENGISHLSFTKYIFDLLQKMVNILRINQRGLNSFDMMFHNHRKYYKLIIKNFFPDYLDVNNILKINS